ncbi:MAG: MoxR family ATPase [Planctomycetaceae bacterium]|jgi:MoxR-like ATPase|nr:MoxR family ATPase [Planctomycetaceae bacterium]
MSNEQIPELELKEKLTQFCDDVRKLESEIGRVLVGQNDVVRGTLIAMIAGGHALLEGVPGLGKTLLVRTLSDAINGKFARIQFTPDLMPADLTGTNVMAENPSGRKVFEFQQGPVFANIVLADEINRATPKTQAALLEAMQEHSVTVGGTSHKIHGLFFVLATQNPLEMEGTYPLPEAQLDRFFCKILVPFPTADEILGILDRTTTAANPHVESKFSADRILEMSALAREIPAADEICRYAVDLILGTHPDSSQAATLVRKYVRFGASPRGAQSLLLGAKINAILDGRFNVSRDDLKIIAPMVLRHRIILNFEGQAENIPTDAVIRELLKKW